jgi:hypothetical protein
VRLARNVFTQLVTFRISSGIKNLEARRRLKERSRPSKQIRSAVKMQKRSNDVPPVFSTVSRYRKEGANRDDG